LQKEFGAKTKTGKGKAGTYDVIVDGKLVFSKADTGRYPKPGEIVKLLKK